GNSFNSREHVIADMLLRHLRKKMKQVQAESVSAFNVTTEQAEDVLKESSSSTNNDNLDQNSNCSESVTETLSQLDINESRVDSSPTRLSMNDLDKAFVDCYKAGKRFQSHSEV